VLSLHQNLSIDALLRAGQKKMLGVETNESRSASEMDDAASCRNRAEKARAIADKLNHPLDKAAWMKVADEWINLAETAEARSDGVVPSTKSKAE
jgi:hypothetical protein